MVVLLWYFSVCVSEFLPGGCVVLCSLGSGGLGLCFFCLGFFVLRCVLFGCVWIVGELLNGWVVLDAFMDFYIL